MVSVVIERWESTSVERQGSEFNVSFMTGKLCAKLGSKGLSGSWGDSGGGW